MRRREKRERASRVRLYLAVLIGFPLALLYAVCLMEATRLGGF